MTYEQFKKEYLMTTRDINILTNANGGAVYGARTQKLTHLIFGMTPTPEIIADDSPQRIPGTSTTAG